MKAGKLWETRNHNMDVPKVRHKITFSFRFVIRYECLKGLLALGKLKPLGPSSILSPSFLQKKLLHLSFQIHQKLLTINHELMVQNVSVLGFSISAQKLKQNTQE